MPHNSKKRGAKRYATQISNADETTEAAPEITYKLHPADVLFGRSSFRVHYRGNVRFRQLVRAKKVEYMGTGRHRQKDGVAREILAMIHSQQGRFLRKLETPGKAPKVSGQDRTAWVVVDETAALETIKQSLREPEEVEEKDPSASIGLMPDGDQDDRMEGHGYLVEEAQVDGSLGHSVTVATNGDDLVSQEDAPTPAPHVQGSIVSLPATLSSPPRLHFYPEVTGDAVAATLPPTQQHLAEQQYVQLGLIAPGSAGSMPATSIASTSDLLSIRQDPDFVRQVLVLVQQHMPDVDASQLASELGQGDFRRLSQYPAFNNAVVALASQLIQSRGAHTTPTVGLAGMAAPNMVHHLPAPLAQQQHSSSYVMAGASQHDAQLPPPTPLTFVNPTSSLIPLTPQSGLGYYLGAPVAPFPLRDFGLVNTHFVPSQGQNQLMPPQPSPPGVLPALFPSLQVSSSATAGMPFTPSYCIVGPQSVVPPYALQPRWTAATVHPYQLPVAGSTSTFYHDPHATPTLGSDLGSQTSTSDR